MARVLAGTARRVLRVVERRALDLSEDTLTPDEPLLALLTAASIRSRIATGPEAGERWQRLGDRVEPMDREEGGIEPDAGIPPRCVREGGMSLHADVAVPANNRRRLERVCRYVSRPPLALDRLEAMADGRLAWANLLQRVFEVDALSCPKCGGRMRVLSAITDPIVAARILRCLALPARAPHLATARERVGPPDFAGELSSKVIPEFDFDQSPPSDDGEDSV